MRLTNKVCIITGGASGMGGVASRLFAKEGAKVVLSDIQDAAGQETQASIRSSGGEALFVHADMSREKDCQKLVAEAVRAFGGVDVLYNNAGIFPQDDHSVTDTSEEVWRKVLDINLMGVTNSCKYAIPEMIKRGKGSVINVASFVALVGCSVPQDEALVPDAGQADGQAEHAHVAQRRVGQAGGGQRDHPQAP